ncbi:MAG TPA: hypothetical protein VFZ72_05765 [Jiangellaceae bacterium]
MPDGKRLLTGAYDDTTRLWDISVGGSKDWLSLAGPPRRRCSLPSGRHEDRHSRRPRWPHDSRHQHGRNARGLRRSRPDDRARNVQSGRHHASRCWRVGPSRRTLVVHVGRPHGRFTRRRHPTLSAVADVAYSPDGRRLGTIEEDGTLRLWNAANGVEQWAMQRWEEAYSLAFSHDGKFVAGSGARFPPDASYAVDQAVFDVDIGEVVASLVGHEDWTPGLVFALDGRVVTASIDGTARVWDVATGDVQATLHHDTGVTHVAVSPDGTNVATAAQDGTSRLWDLATGRQVLTLHGHNAPVRNVAAGLDTQTHRRGWSPASRRGARPLRAGSRPVARRHRGVSADSLDTRGIGRPRWLGRLPIPAERVLRAPRAERRRLWTATEAAVADPLASGHALHTYAD